MHGSNSVAKIQHVTGITSSYSPPSLQPTPPLTLHVPGTPDAIAQSKLIILHNLDVAEVLPLWVY